VRVLRYKRFSKRQRELLPFRVELFERPLLPVNDADVGHGERHMFGFVHAASDMGREHLRMSFKHAELVE